MCSVAERRGHVQGALLQSLCVLDTVGKNIDIVTLLKMVSITLRNYHHTHLPLPCFVVEYCLFFIYLTLEGSAMNAATYFNNPKKVIVEHTF